MTECRNAASRKAVDVWIASDLARRFDLALEEPLPPELLALLED